MKLGTVIWRKVSSEDMHLFLFELVVFGVASLAATSEHVASPSLPASSMSMSYFCLDERHDVLPSTKKVSEATVCSKTACAERCSTEESCTSFKYNSDNDVCSLYKGYIENSHLKTSKHRILFYRKRTSKPPLTSRRILIIPKHSKDVCKFLQMDVFNNSLTPYPHLRVFNVRALAYISASRKILVATRHQIIASSLDTHDHGLFKKGIICYHMSVDQEERLVFVCEKSKKMHITKMKTDGTHAKRLYSRELRFSVVTIETVPAVRKLFIASNNALYSLTYTGLFNTVRKGRSIQSLSFDFNGNVLYFLDNRMLKQMNIFQNKTTDVTTIPGVMSNIIYYHDHLYVRIYSSGIKVWNVLKNERMNVRLRRYYKKTGNVIILCLIP